MAAKLNKSVCFFVWSFPSLTHVAERLAEELSLSVLTTYVCRGWPGIRTFNFPHANRTLLLTAPPPRNDNKHGKVYNLMIP